MNKLSNIIFWLIIIFFLSLVFLDISKADSIERDITKEEQAKCGEIGETIRKIQIYRSTPIWDFWYKHSEEFDNDVTAWYISRYVYREVPENMHPQQAKTAFIMHCHKSVYESKPELRYQL